MTKKLWSIKSIQDLVLEKPKWGEKKTIYATDADKCPSGVYHSIIGTEPDTEIDPEGLRRMAIGEMVEWGQVKKLKSLGLFIEPLSGSQHRVHNEEYNVSGRLDGLLVNPEQCLPETKRMMKRKAEIFKRLEDLNSNFYKGLEGHVSGEVSLEKFKEGRNKLADLTYEIHKENRAINSELLKPNPKVRLEILEIKSINEYGFERLKKEDRPMEAHHKQEMFYLSELRKTYPNIGARIVYAQIPYQELMEFEIEYSEDLMRQLQGFWAMINDSLKKKKAPEPSPSMILNSYSNKWRLNFQAEWCRYHVRCTGDPNWKTKALIEVKKLNNEKVIQLEPDAPKTKGRTTKKIKL